MTRLYIANYSRSYIGFLYLLNCIVDSYVSQLIKTVIKSQLGLVTCILTMQVWTYGLHPHFTLSYDLWWMSGESVCYFFDNCLILSQLLFSKVPICSISFLTGFLFYKFTGHSTVRYYSRTKQNFCHASCFAR